MIAVLAPRPSRMWRSRKWSTRLYTSAIICAGPILQPVYHRRVFPGGCRNANSTPHVAKFGRNSHVHNASNEVTEQTAARQRDHGGAQHVHERGGQPPAPGR